LNGTEAAVYQLMTSAH